eukprot:scaffold166_cov106-Skeletonema_dohrnii-CCMP3373.AAC.3
MRQGSRPGEEVNGEKLAMGSLKRPNLHASKASCRIAQHSNRLIRGGRREEEDMQRWRLSSS